MILRYMCHKMHSVIPTSRTGCGEGTLGGKADGAERSRKAAKRYCSLFRITRNFTSNLLSGWFGRVNGSCCLGSSVARLIWSFSLPHSGPGQRLIRLATRRPSIAKVPVQPLRGPLSADVWRPPRDNRVQVWGGVYAL